MKNKWGLSLAAALSVTLITLGGLGTWLLLRNSTSTMRIPHMRSHQLALDSQTPKRTPNTTPRSTCTTSQLSFKSQTVGLVGPGLSYLIGVIRNTSGTSCYVGGVPSISEVDMQGHPTTSFSLTAGLTARLQRLATTAQSIQLTPQGSSSFYFEISSCANYNPSLAQIGPILFEATIPNLQGPRIQLSQELSRADGCRIERLLEMSSIRLGVISHIPDLSYAGASTPTPPPLTK